MLGEQDKVCNELMSTSDIDRDGNTGVACLGTRNRGHCALSEALRLEGGIDGGLRIRRRRGGWCVTHERSPGLFSGN